MEQVNEVLSKMELEHLAEVREVTNIAVTAGWARVMKQIEAFVEEAHEDIFANVSLDPRNAQLLQIRWQQREAVLRGILHFVKTCQDTKRDLLQSQDGYQAMQEVRSGEAD